MPTEKLRIVTFNNRAGPFGVVKTWLAQTGHEVVLVVTTPGPSRRRSETYREVVAQTPPEWDVLVTTRLRKVALPLLRELKPDLILSFTFPFLIPPELIATARIGAVNLHPTALPAYRGPNVMRVVYEGFPLLGATLHWSAPDFDTGPILSQHTAPMPDDVTVENIMAVWPKLMLGALAEGVERAAAGERGVAQDESKASYAAAFTEDEQWLDWDQPARELQRKVTALNMLSPGTAKVRINGEPRSVTRISPTTSGAGDRAPGTVVAQDEAGALVVAGDSVARVQWG